MSCTVENDLTAYLDGELSAEAASRMKAHLATCEDCRATEVLLHRTVSSLRSLPDFEPSRGLCIAARRTPPIKAGVLMSCLIHRVWP